LKAIHNKDYSVVKTFKPPRLTIRGFYIYIDFIGFSAYFRRPFGSRFFIG